MKKGFKIWTETTEKYNALLHHKKLATVAVSFHAEHHILILDVTRTQIDVPTVLWRLPGLLAAQTGGKRDETPTA